MNKINGKKKIQNLFSNPISKLNNLNIFQYQSKSKTTKPNQKETYLQRVDGWQEAMGEREGY